MSESKKILRSVAQFPEKVKETTATCSDKAHILAIETQMALANDCFRKGDYKQAIENYQIAIDLQADHVSAHYNLGLAYLAVEELENAMRILQRACELNSNHARAHYFLGYTYQQKKQFDKAIDYYERSTALDPDHFDSHLNKGRSQGNLERLDDAILSYERALQLNARDLNANFELGYLHNRKGNLEESIHYYRRAVETEPDRPETNCNLAHSLRYAGKMYDAIPLDLFAPLTKLPGVTVYSLQKMNGTEQLLTLPLVEVHDFGPEFDSEHGRFMDTASVTKQMDLVISADTSVAHLAAAQGIATWALLPYVADWRWLTDRTDTPWYPTMKLFRQKTASDWKSVIDDVVVQLEKKLFGSSTHKNSSPIAEVSIGELIDKMTILEIKSERIQDRTKLRNITNERQGLRDVFDAYVNKNDRTKQLFGLIRELKSVNEKLWDIEDDIREKEAHKEFDSKFIELSRSVYFSNDERGRLKRAINDLLGSRLVEEKLYKSY